MDTISNSTTPRQITPEEIYDHKALIIDLGLKLGLDRSTCDDFIQYVTLKCYGNAKIVYDPSKGSLEGYIYRIAHNVCIDRFYRFNRRKVKLTYTDEAELFDHQDAIDSFREESLDRRERLELIKTGIDRLSEISISTKQLQAFLIYVNENCSSKEIARKLGVTESFVNVAKHRCIERLKDIVNKLVRDAS